MRRRRMKECECGKPNQSLDGSEPLPRIRQSISQHTQHQNREERGKMHTMDIKWCEQKRKKKTGEENPSQLLVFEDSNSFLICGQPNQLEVKLMSSCSSSNFLLNKSLFMCSFRFSYSFQILSFCFLCHDSTFRFATIINECNIMHLTKLLSQVIPFLS
jgi:hypothetical protein